MSRRHDGEKLLCRIGRSYRVRTEPLRIGDLSLAFTRIADPDQMVDRLFVEEDRLEKINGRPTPDDQLHMPYWAQLWDSALGLAGALARQGLGAGRGRAVAVLDLGCGMGLAGTVAAALGGRVLFGDLEAPALLLARLNSLPHRRRVRTRRLDWRTAELGESFDLILGADILYERSQWPALEAFWRRHLEPGGRVLLSEPHRGGGDAFIVWIQERGWRLTQGEQALAGSGKTIRILELRLG